MKLIQPHRHGFSLIEVLTSMAVLGLLMLLLSQIVSGTFSAWTRGRSQLEKFEQARAAMQTLQDRLADAVLTPYLEYQFDPAAPTIPVAYEPQSALRFRVAPAAELFTAGPELSMSGHGVSFTAMLGHEDFALRSRPSLALNACGFFVAHGEDLRGLPSAPAAAGLKPRQRFRLYHTCQPASQFAAYSEWHDPLQPWSSESAHPIAENIALLVLVPMTDEETLVGGDTYDSSQHRHELPALLRVILLALDDRSAQRVEDAQLRTQLIPEGLFRDLTTPAEVTADLERLRQHLDQSLGLPIDYQIMDQLIALPPCQWNG